LKISLHQSDQMASSYRPVYSFKLLLVHENRTWRPYRGGSPSDFRLEENFRRPYFGSTDLKCNLDSTARACPVMEPTTQPNGHLWEMCGPATGSPAAKPELGTSCLKLGLWQGYQSPISVLWPASPPPRRTCCERRRHKILIRSCRSFGIFVD